MFVGAPFTVAVFGGATSNCVLSTSMRGNCVVRMNMSSCSITKIRPSMGEDEDRDFDLVVTGGTFDGINDIIFKVWESQASGSTELLSKSLVGGDITVINPTLARFSISNVESGAIGQGQKYCEAWVIYSSLKRDVIGKGPFLMEDTRNYD